jgi:MATE family multidrug resistance protein
MQIPTRAELGALARLAAPLAIAQAAVILMSVVDTLVVGRFDATHLAGVGVGSAVSHGVLVFGMGFALALEPLVAQALGAGEAHRAFAWWRTGARVTLLVGVPLSALALGLTAASEAFGVEAAIVDLALDYALARTPANLAFLYWIASRAFLQSQQRTRPLLIAAAVANVLNAVADVALVDGLVTLGATGAGLATSASSLILLVVAARAIALGAPVGEAPRAAGTGVSARALLRLGAPISLQLAAEFLVFSTAGVLAAGLGAMEGAAHQVAINCATVTFMLAGGLGGAAASLVGDAVGRGDTLLARRRALAAVVLALGLMGTSAVCFALLADPLADAFTADGDPAVAGLAAELLRIAALFQLFDGAQVVLGAVLRGAGDVRVPLVMTLAAYWAVGFTVALGLAFGAGLGAVGLWLGLSAGLASASLALGLRARVVFARPIARV